MFHNYPRLSTSQGYLFQYDVKHINTITITLPSKYHDQTDWLVEDAHVCDILVYI